MPAPQPCILSPRVHCVCLRVFDLCCVLLAASGSMKREHEYVICTVCGLGAVPRVNSVHMLGHGRIVYCSWCCSTRLPHTEKEALVSGQVLCGVLRSNRSEQLCWRREDRSVTPLGRLAGCASGGCIMSKASPVLAHGDSCTIPTRIKGHVRRQHCSCWKGWDGWLVAAGRSTYAAVEHYALGDVSCYVLYTAAVYTQWQQGVLQRVMHCTQLELQVELQMLLC